MAAPQFLHVGFNFPKRTPPVSDLEAVFNRGVDWMRYASNCWIVYTAHSPQAWYLRFKPILSPEDSVLICRVDLKERYGSLPKWAWEWMTKDRTRPPSE